MHDAFCVGACMTGVTQYNIAPCRACWISVNTRLLFTRILFDVFCVFSVFIHEG